MGFGSLIASAGKVAGTAALASNPLALAGAAFGKVDLTPGYGAKNVINTQLSRTKINNNAGNSKKKAAGQQQPNSLGGTSLDNGQYQGGDYNGTGTGGAGGTGRSAAADAALAAAYDAQISTYRNLLGNLGAQQNAQRDILEGGFRAGRSSLDTSRNRALEDLSRQDNEVKQNRARSLNDLAMRGRNMVQSLNNQFGVMGAGSSSASQVLAPYAIAQQQNRLGGDVNNQAQDQFSKITSQKTRVNEDYRTSLEELDRDRLGKLMEVSSKFSELANQYQLAMQTADAQKAQALNGAYTAAVGDVNAQVQAIEQTHNSNMSNLRNYYANFHPTVKAIKPVDNSVQNINTAGFEDAGVDPGVSQQQITAAFLGDNTDEQNKPVIY